MKSGPNDKMRKYETMVAELLTSLNLGWEFEKNVYTITTRMPGQRCVFCGKEQYKATKYTPDFVLSNETVIEVKGGSFKPTDQARYKRFVKQHPDVNYIMAFRSNVRLKNLKAKPTVREWGEQNDIKVVVGLDELRGILK